ncbi:putative protein G1-like4 [Iris pallida]|uniref:Uncharacterized protein n=1 Tax=Iris pallida TaxID=29817 RepID=A0AAX6HF83_IRIPA|nr:putative protein G1-like4 [Iris pallida]
MDIEPNPPDSPPSGGLALRPPLQRYPSSSSIVPVLLLFVVAVAVPLRVAEAPRLEHLQPVPQEPPPTALPRPLQRRHVLEFLLPRPVRQDQGARGHVPLLRPPEPPCPLPLPAAPGVGQPRRAHRPPPRRVRRERGPPRGQPLRLAPRPALPPRGARHAVEGEGGQLRQEEAQKNSRSSRGRRTTGRTSRHCHHLQVQA